jgi:flagellar hook assembly protein FlgD
MIDITSKGKPVKAKLEIFNLKGQLVKTAVLNSDSKYTWNGTDKDNRKVPIGMYFLKLTNGSQIKTQKVLLLK